jgi:hypothetical protein
MIVSADAAAAQLMTLSKKKGRVRAAAADGKRHTLITTTTA